MQAFSITHTVRKEEIDDLQHVNNVVYVQWIQEVANLHWKKLTVNEPSQNYLWVVIRHEVDYLKSAVLGDEITLKTWIGESAGLKSIRHVEILKKKVLLAKAKTTWCMIDAKTYKPIRLPANVLKILNPS